MNNDGHTAAMTVARTCILYSTGTLLIMAGLSFDPAVSFKYGALLTFLLAGFLLIKGTETTTQTQHSDATVPSSSQLTSRDVEDNQNPETEALTAAYLKGCQVTLISALLLWLVSICLAGMN
ncbi:MULTISPECIES: hypothetical protein [Pseudovibrio]|uniref:hypothetical protein n=1 Tax=Stappiaceae TaxID=2821832 RepID=UPI002366B431|nr:MULTISPECIES: hypothetical protein [Pseudovibrio]MDD7911112.1 hypothetical protein [Pseudovibrio exalbescens]MDX5593201.1 hypothetical protein [Pseudovibrio sp. SPO723]